MMGICPVCKRYGPLEQHHIFGGPYRRKSDRYGLTIYLCHWCHNEPPNGVHHSAEMAQRLREYGQRKWMAEQDKTIEDFRREFGRNYL